MESKFITVSGVEVTLRPLLGEDFDKIIKMTQLSESKGEAPKTLEVITSCIVAIGDNRNPSKEELESIPDMDLTHIMVELRLLSFFADTKFYHVVPMSLYSVSSGKVLKKSDPVRFTVNVRRSEIEIEYAKGVLGEDGKPKRRYKSFSEIKPYTIEIPEVEGTFKMTPPTQKGAANMTENPDLSTIITIRNPKQVKEGQDLIYDPKKGYHFVNERMRMSIRENEGFVETELKLVNPSNSEDVHRVSMLSAVGFFCPSLALRQAYTRCAPTQSSEPQD